MILKGNSKTIEKKIKFFKNNNDMNCMLMVSNTSCAGLNLEFVTDLIFYHSIKNEQIVGQLVGRAQRVLRSVGPYCPYMRPKSSFPD